jgi:hypothetical protein
MGNHNSKVNQNAVIGQMTGGLGNQLFVIAATYAYCKKYNKNFYITASWKDYSKERPDYWDNILSFIKLNRNLVFNSQIKKVKSYEYKSSEYKEIPEFNHNIILKGYFQSEKYFKEYKNEIRTMLSLPEYYKKLANVKLAKFGEEIIVAIHIRRGDYLKHPGVYHILSKNYYDNAKKVLEEKIGFRPIYLYFSNDKKWVKEHFILEGKDEIIEELKDYVEFAIMSQCHHFIIANSTFSWWAAYLSNTLERILPKIVIVPENWYGEKWTEDWKDIYPEGWIRISDNVEYKNIEDINSKYFLGIITCKAYEHKRKTQDLSQCPFRYKYFIGDKSLSEFKEEDDIVYLPCPDNYESLPQKIYQMIKYVKETYPDNKYIIKCDDDITFDFKKFKTLKNKIYIENLDYIGVEVKNKEYYGTCHLGKTEDPILSKIKIKVPKSIYCAGPCYILSDKSSNILLENLLKNNTIYEDQSVGNCLEEFKILPYNTNMKNYGFNWE